jgi:DNA-binding transcriptional MerR regulator
VDKAPDAFRTISEVAEEINVPQHVLRFWESRFTQIRPLKRGGGRRYYRPDDIDLLRGVRHLLYGEGYTIRGVQRILREQGLSFVQSAWRADAPPPPPQLEEDKMSEAEGQADIPTKREPSLGGFAMPDSAAASSEHSARREPTLTPPPAAGKSSPQRLGADSEERRKLEAALEELITCRRVLDAAIMDNFTPET